MSLPRYQRQVYQFEYYGSRQKLKKNYNLNILFVHFT